MANLHPAHSGSPLPLTQAAHLSSMPPIVHLIPTWEGFVSSTGDALILFEAALRGDLPRTVRRPHDRERAGLIKSGSVFIYEENASGIKRWTDGLPWSPSRILGNYLIYRELDKPFPPGEKKRATKKSKRNSTAEPYPTSRHPSLAEPVTESPIDSPYLPLQPSMSNTISPLSAGTRRSSGGEGIDGVLHKHLVGSLTDSYQFKEQGLIKKTMSVKFSETVVYHLVSYYKMEDCVGNKLLRVPTDPKLRALDLTPRRELFTCQTWRAPIDEGQRIEEGLFPGNIASTYHASHQNWTVPGLHHVISNPPILPEMLKQETYALPSMQPPITMHPGQQSGQTFYTSSANTTPTSAIMPYRPSALNHPAANQEVGVHHSGYHQSAIYQHEHRSTGSIHSSSQRSEHDYTVNHRSLSNQALAGSNAAVMSPTDRSPYDAVAKGSLIPSYTYSPNNHSPTSVVSPHSGFDPHRTSYSQQIPAYAQGFGQLPPMDQQQHLSHHQQQQYQQPPHVSRQQFDQMAQFSPLAQMSSQTQQQMQSQLMHPMQSIQPLPNLDTSYNLPPHVNGMTPQEQQQYFAGQTGWTHQ